MKIVLISMPDVTPVIIHETAVHMPNLGIASIGANIDEKHEVYVIDLIRKRRQVRKYLTRTLLKIRPDLVGLSAMTWQFDTCVKIIRLIKRLLPHVGIAIGGYHATLMYKEIAASDESELIDFMIRGEGEEAFRRLVDALDGKDRFKDIASLSYKMASEQMNPQKKEGNLFIHNPKGDLLDLSRIKLPIRDKRRLTWGYHVVYNKIEVMETSRGCTRSCNFCSIRHMYGKSFRVYPVERVLADLDDIYYKRKTRWAFIADDNLVLAPERDITQAAVKAVSNCHRYGIMVIGGLIHGFPDDDDAAIIRNYEFFNALKIDAVYTQILTPYPKTGIRQNLKDEGLITNLYDYRYYNGLWANVKTRHLSSEQLQYLFWYRKQTVMGWWEPSELAGRDGKLWTSIWRLAFRPVLRYFINRNLRKYGWQGRYQKELLRLSSMNRFDDIK
ncbi:MAG: cobalamin-dependent protein [Desulfobacteraceae bacterium]|nr:cobalamin-dependent protein [Desulfobacteraceae bacterium]